MDPESQRPIKHCKSRPENTKEKKGKEKSYPGSTHLEVDEPRPPRNENTKNTRHQPENSTQPTPSQHALIPKQPSPEPLLLWRFLWRRRRSWSGAIVSPLTTMVSRTAGLTAILKRPSLATPASVDLWRRDVQFPLATPASVDLGRRDVQFPLGPYGGPFGAETCITVS